MTASHRARVDMIKAWASHDADTFNAFVEAVRSEGLDPFTARVLDIGCGANAPMSLLLHAAGATVTGIDHYVGYRWGLGFSPARYLRYLKEAGVSRTLRKILGEAVYDRRYYETLSAATGLQLNEHRLDLREMPVTKLDLPTGSVKLIHSNATWEHIADVAQANREVARVLAPGGLAYIELHLFASISGGHDLPWIVPGKTDLGGQQPWRHLLDPAWRAPVFLNRLREREFDRLFRETPGLEVVSCRTEYTEGAEHLTPEIAAALSGYSKEELTKRSVIFLLRRRNDPVP